MHIHCSFVMRIVQNPVHHAESGPPGPPQCREASPAESQLAESAHAVFQELQ
jgi:hypothetical protein